MREDEFVCVFCGSDLPESVERGSHRVMAEVHRHALMAVTRTVTSLRTASSSYRVATARFLWRRLIPHSTA